MKRLFASYEDTFYDGFSINIYYCDNSNSFNDNSLINNISIEEYNEEELSIDINDEIISINTKFIEDNISDKFSVIVLNFGDTFTECCVAYSNIHESYENALNEVHKIYSQSEKTLPKSYDINNNDYSGNYRHQGYYPEVPEHITNMNYIDILHKPLYGEMIALLIFKIEKSGDISLINNIGIRHYL